MPPGSSVPFHLSKWYFDCVGDDGEVFIGYAGLARYRRASFSYSSVLRYQDARGMVTDSSLRPFRAPAEDADTIHWTPAGLGLEGSWFRTSEPLFARVFPSIEWRCCQPRGDARIRFGDGTELHGLGYVEQLVMTQAPWQLPIRTLRWGRFLHPQAAMVWIDWIDWLGQASRRIVFHNGVQVDASIPSDHEILLSGARLTLDCGAVLRSGALGQTVLGAIRSVARWVPGKMLRVRETKWRSRATLHSSRGPALEGWAIHEVVEW